LTADEFCFAVPILSLKTFDFPTCSPGSSSLVWVRHQGINQVCRNYFLYRLELVLGHSFFAQGRNGSQS
jgi:hypothetical protein